MDIYVCDVYWRCFWWPYHRVWFIMVSNCFFLRRVREIWLAPHFCWSVPISRLWVRVGGQTVQSDASMRFRHYWRAQKALDRASPKPTEADCKMCYHVQLCIVYDERSIKRNAFIHVDVRVRGLTNPRPKKEATKQS